MLELIPAHSSVLFPEVNNLLFTVTSYGHMLANDISAVVHSTAENVSYWFQNNFDSLFNQVKNIPSGTLTSTTTSTTLAGMTLLYVSSLKNTAKDVSEILSPITDPGVSPIDILYGEYYEKLLDFKNRITSAFFKLKSHAMKGCGEVQTKFHQIFMKRVNDS